MTPCLRITDGKPRAAFDTEAEAEAFALTNPNYFGDVPWRCSRCGEVHLYIPEWLLPNRVAQIRRGNELLSSPVGDQDACIEWLRNTLEAGDKFIDIHSTELVRQ